MKRKILALATALALALSLSVCVSAAGQQAGSWTKLSDGYTADVPGTQPTAVPLPDKDTYAITDWVDADHALCVKSLGDKDRAFVVVGRDGSEVTLQSSRQRPGASPTRTRPTTRSMLASSRASLR